ncbi:hypothetical protein [Streptomyces sp. NBC_00690]|uniref:hypothetical protein n=1 Tax=Streptomyces sp. NBC_00690 TaxID=2975808 RepID=UPI002E295509|nr:hypothetical protein [Streptomyces sp. NBC_00690]
MRKALVPAPTPPDAQPPTPTVWPEPVYRLTPARHRALEIIARHSVVVRDFSRRLARVSTGISARITMPVFEALQADGLIVRDRSTSLYTGQRVLLTPAGQATLNALGEAPPSGPGIAAPRAPARGHTR